MEKRYEERMRERERERERENSRAHKASTQSVFVCLREKESESPSEASLRELLSIVLQAIALFASLVDFLQQKTKAFNTKITHEN